MDKLFAKRMDELVPSGIRKVNEKALAMERAGETVIHFELGRPDFDTPEYIKNACIEDIKKGDVFYTSNFVREFLVQFISLVCHENAPFKIGNGTGNGKFPEKRLI